MRRVGIFLEYGIELGFYSSLYFWVQFPNYPLYFQTIGAFVAIFFWILKSIVEKRIVYKHFPWNIWILLLNVTIWLTVIWSINRTQSIFYNLVFTAGSIYMVLLSSCFHSKAQVIRLVSFLLLVSTYFALKAIVPNLPSFVQNFRSGASLVDKILFRTSQYTRIKSSMGDANSVGGLYAVLISFLLPFLLFGFRSKPLAIEQSTQGKMDTNPDDKNVEGSSGCNTERGVDQKHGSIKRFRFWVFLGKFVAQIIGWAICGIFTLALLMSASRGALFGLVFSLLLVYLVQNRLATNINYLLLLLTSSLLPSFQFFMYSLYAVIVDETRYVIYQNAIELAKIVPFMGIGMGNFAKAYWYYFHEEFNHAHNIFINTAVELGIPGVIFFTLLGGSFVYYGILYTLRQRGKDPFYYAVNLGLTSLVFGFLVRCLVDYTI